MSRSMYSLAALLAGCALLPVSSLAQLSFQPRQVAQVRSVSNVVAHGDFNNDGREDLVVITYNPTSQTYIDQLYLSSGDGSYEAPMAMPDLVRAVGDFNNDGKLDFAALGSPGVLSVYLGNGDGTFQAPRTSTGLGSAFSSLIPADLNHDGKTDLVGSYFGDGAGGSATLQLLISNGDGTFSKGQTIVASTGSLAKQAATGAVTGDFDGDGKPDIALIYGITYDSATAKENPLPTTVQVWYGDGAGHLGSPSLTTDPNKYYDFSAIAADVNNDGRSDIVSVASTPGAGGTKFLPVLSIFTGNSNRTLSYKTTATSECAGQGSENITVADFNGDGLNDLVYDENTCSSTSSANTEVAVRLGTGSGNFGPEQFVYQNLYQIGLLYAVRTTLDTKPDLVFDRFNGGTTDTIELLSNTSTGNFPGCGLSGFAEGVQVCTPGASATSPVKFSVAAAGPTPMRTAAVWVDGKKVAEQLTHAFSNYSFLDASVPLAAGSHAITVYGAGWDNTLQKKSFTLTVASGASCSAPASPGVHVCAPASGASVPSPVQIQAAGTVTNTFARMEVWIDGVEKYAESTGTTLNTTLSLPAGSHRFAVLAINTAGAKWEQVVNATVK